MSACKVKSIDIINVFLLREKYTIIRKKEKLTITLTYKRELCIIYIVRQIKIQNLIT